MKIIQLSVKKDISDRLEIAWTLSRGAQSAYELFLIRNGAVVEAAKARSKLTRCRLSTEIEPMKGYAVLLTVTNGQRTASVCAGFYPMKEKELCQTIYY